MRNYLIVLLVLGVLVGGMHFYKYITNDDNSLVESKIPKQKNKEEKEEDIEILPIQHIDQKIKDKTLRIAEQFLDGYVNYDSSDPIAYVDKIKPYVSEQFFIKHVQHPKREPLTVKSYKWDIEKSKISFAESTGTKNVELSDTITIYAEITRIKTTTDNKTIDEPIEYWIEFEKINDDDYLINEINIQDGKQYKFSSD